MKTKTAVLVLATIAISSCGGDSSPTTETPVAAADAFATGSALQQQGTVTVSEILSAPANFFGQQVQLQGFATQPLGDTSFLFTDGTGAIPLDFTAGPFPTLNETILVTGTVVPGTADFAARINVLSWEMPAAFSCDDVVEIRARFSDPGFVAGDVVGLYLAYRGVPAGMKTLEIDWDEGAPNTTDHFELGEGSPGDDGLFNLEGVVGHEYPNITSTQTKSVRTQLRIDGREGACTRVRDVTVTKGSGPGFAAGGNLRLSFNDPVPSGGFFSVSATVTNPSGGTADAELLFQTPDGSSIRTMGAGCQKVESNQVECIIRDIAPGSSGAEFVQYDVPEVTKPRVIYGSVTLIARDFAPVANYSTTVEP